jgi:serine---pyruvate transaminase
MKKYYLITPGPTPVPPRVAARSSEPILHHRTKEFGEVFKAVQEGMKYVIKTKQDVMMLAGSGTSAMEAAVVNTLSPGDHVIVGSMGSFGERFIKICEAFGVKVTAIREEWGTPVNPAKIEDALKKDPAVKAVLIQHTDTSSTTLNDVKAVADIVAKTPAILIVDSVSGLGGEEMHMDDWKVDVLVTGCQKGLMTAPGISMVAMSDKAWAHHKQARCPRFSVDFSIIRASIKDSETPWTPPVTLFLSLSEALRMIKEEGIENSWARHKKLAVAARAAVQALGFKLLSSRPANVLTGAVLPQGFDGVLLLRKMLDELGVSIAGGQEHLKGKIFRIAHMGYMNAFDLMVGFGALEKTLTDMGYKLPEPGKAIKLAQSALA